MKAYLAVLNEIFENGVRTLDTRTGTPTLAGHSFQMRHNLANGFPLITTRQMYFKSIAVETEGYLKGITDKKWYQDHGCSFWNEWCAQTPLKKRQTELNDFSNKTRIEIQKEERDMFSGYGWEWNHYGIKYEGYEKDYTGMGENQIVKAVNTLKTNPMSRRIILRTSSVLNESEYALEPCLDDYQFCTFNGIHLNLTVTQRSGDVCKGVPNDFAQSALLLHLMANTVGMIPHMLTIQYKIPHIYLPHLQDAMMQAKREPFPLPKLVLTPGTDIFNFTAAKAKIENYVHHAAINYSREV